MQTRSGNRARESFQHLKQIYGGCGIAYAMRLPAPLSEVAMAEAKSAGISIQQSTKNAGPLALVREMLLRMDLRTNGEGAGIAFKRSTSNLHERDGFPMDYEKGGKNLFTVFAFAYERDDANKLKDYFKASGFEVRRKREHEQASAGRDVTRGSEVIELAVVVQPEQEPAFVQLCNRINAQEGPKVYSAGVGTGLIKIVGRADELYGAFPSVFEKDRRYDWALGHGRFPTNTPDSMTASQPHWAITYNDKGISYTYSSENGEVTNNDGLRTLLQGMRHFHLSNVAGKIPTNGKDGIASMLTASDGETIPHVANYLHSRGLSSSQIGMVLAGDLELPFGNGMLGMSGPVAVVCQGSDGTIAFRDSRRLRPLQAGLASDGKSAYMLLSSEEGALLSALSKNEFTPISVWPVRDWLSLEKNPSIEAFKKAIPPPGAGIFMRKKEHFAPSITSAANIEFDVHNARKAVENLSLSELFRRRLLPGDNGKCFDERETYVQREIAFGIREKIASAVLAEMGKQAGKDSIELNVRISGLQGERSLAVGVFNHLKRTLPPSSLPAALKINWQLDGAIGDNLGAFCGPATSIEGFGNGGENLLNTARGASVTLHGNAGGSALYGASDSTTAYVFGDIGPRGGAYMKGTSEASPLLVVGGFADKYVGGSAHMGTVLVLNKNNEQQAVGAGAAAGIEGKARVIVRGTVSQELAEGVAARQPTEQELVEILGYVREYCTKFGLGERKLKELSGGPFTILEKDKNTNTHPFVQVIPQKEEFMFPPEIQKKILLMAGVDAKTKEWDSRFAHGVRLAKGMGARPGPYPLNAAMVTAPPVDVREDLHMEKMLRIPLAQQNVEGQTYEQISGNKNGCHTTAMVFGSMSRGALSHGTWMAIHDTALELGILVGSGEGGLPSQIGAPSPFLVRQLASGRFGIETDNLSGQDYFGDAHVIEIKIAQGAKPGKGGTLGASKVTAEIAGLRGIEEGTPAISPPTHHDVYSIEDIKKLIELTRMVGGEDVKISVKIAATNDLEQIVSGLVKGGANIINIAGSEGGTGFATVLSNQTGIGAFEGIERAHRALVNDGLRNYVTLIVSGGFYDGHGVVRAHALGANSVELGSALLASMGCTQCQMCIGGNCHVGLTSVSDEKLTSQARPRLKTYVYSLMHEIKDILQQNGVTSLAHATGNTNLLIKNRHPPVYVHS